jgi:hypothetical protein
MAAKQPTDKTTTAKPVEAGTPTVEMAPPAELTPAEVKAEARQALADAAAEDAARAAADKKAAAAKKADATPPVADAAGTTTTVETGTDKKGVETQTTTTTFDPGGATTSAQAAVITVVTNPDPVIGADVPADDSHLDAATKRKIARRECIVDDGTPHMGEAVNGWICSAHAIGYRSDGTKRVPLAAGRRR